MAAVPIISAGVGIVGAITSASARKKEERRQTDLVNAQLLADQQSQALRYQDITAQRQFQYQTYVTENMQRLQEFNQAETQFRSQALQNQAETSIQAGQNANQRAAAERGLVQAAEQVRQRTGEYDSQAAAVQYAALAQQAQSNDEVAKAMQQIQVAVQQGDAELAGYGGRLLANSGGSRRSAADQASQESQSNNQLAQLLAGFSNAQNASEVDLENVINSQEFAELLRAVNEVESGSANESLNRQFASAADTINANNRINDIAFNTNAGAISGALRMAPVNAQIQQGQADINFLVGSNATGSQGAGIAAQSLQNQAQLLRSLPPKTGFLSDALNVVAAGMPLASYAMQQNAMRQQQPTGAISTFRPVIYDVRPTLNTEFYA